MFSKPRLSSDPYILYVEDLPINVFLMEKMFEKVPHLRLVVATCGEQAWQKVQEETPGFLMLDLNLPDCHGVDLLRRLRTNTGCWDLPAVAVTAENNFQVEGTGFLEVWPKPLDMPWTLSRLKHFSQTIGRAHDFGHRIKIPSNQSFPRWAA
jgi:CheY-like chemotaxis protein